MLVFEERGKPEYLEKNLSEQGREPSTNSTRIWHWHQDLNPGHIGGRRALSPLRHPLLPKLINDNGDTACHPNMDSATPFRFSTMIEMLKTNYLGLHLDSQSSYLREPTRQILFIRQLNGKGKKLRSCASFFPWQHSYLLSSKFAPIWFYIPNFPRFNSDPHGSASSTSSGESASLDYISFHFFVLLYFIALSGRHLSRDSVTGRFPSFSAVAPSDVAAFQEGQILPAAGLAIPARPLPR